MIGRFFYGVYYNTLGIIQDMASDTDTEVIVKSFEKAYRKIKMIFSESNYFIGVVLNNLGYAHLKKGNVGKCQKYLKKSLENYLKVFGDKHSHPDLEVIIRNCNRVLMADQKKLYGNLHETTLKDGTSSTGPNYLFIHLF